ncbi:hypothetical protein ACIGO8_09475 [Streptomyces sp. NPDC053493]|uniref:hypothetical protein n=1 Tax=Streptomyces sp. NPDC053493 TaxID=3365705 RepID=UPI0037D93EC0
MTTPQIRPAAPQSVTAIRARAVRAQGWGLGLLTVAALLWVWFAVLLLTPYETSAGNGCGTVLTDDYVHDQACYETRDWPELLGLLGASLPFAVAGAIVYVRGSVTDRLAALVTGTDAA